jgi:hypothetical protein
MAAQMESLGAQNRSSKDQIDEKERKIAELYKKLKSLENDKVDLLDMLNKLQSEKVSPPPSSGASSPYASGVSQADPQVDAVKLGKIVVQRASGRAARVEHVDKVYGFLVVNAGSEDGLRSDAVLNILRNNELIGKAVVQKVRRTVSAAVILPEWTKDEVRVGDFISKY